MEENKEVPQPEEKVEAQSVSLAMVAWFVLTNAVKGIIGYIAIWCFKPIWAWITGEKKKPDSEDD